MVVNVNDNLHNEGFLRRHLAYAGGPQAVQLQAMRAEVCPTLRTQALDGAHSANSVSVSARARQPGCRQALVDTLPPNRCS